MVIVNFSDNPPVFFSLWVSKLTTIPELVNLLSHNLYETVKDKYHIDTVTKKRAEFYETIVKDNKKEVEQLIEETNAV